MMIIKIVIKTLKKEIVVNKKYNLDLSFDNYVFNIYILFNVIVNLIAIK